MKNSKPLHLVAGSRGAMGSAVVRDLLNRGENVQAIGKTTSSERIETKIVDLYDSNSLIEALKDVDYFYLCVGLPYNSKYWLENWPKLMKSCVEACIASNTVLVFLDNIYMYSPPLPLFFDEKTEQVPKSIKGIARKMAADLILDGIKNDNLKAVIGRSASFLGPGVVNSSLYTSFLDRMLAGKSPQSIFNPSIPITYAYIEDNAKALVELALNSKSYGEVYHLPVGKPISLKEILDICNKVLGKNYKLSIMPKLLFKILCLFIPIFREIDEMRYQYDEPYTMSYDKFSKLFPKFQVTSNEEGIQKMIESFQKQ
jgi:nucleoside-diphosphate-sugar epimerase